MKDWFDELYEQALPVVYGYFFRRCGGRVEIAEELTQETFLSAVRAVEQGTSVHAPMPWLISIARRRLVDHYRRERLHRDRTGQLLGNAVPATRSSPSMTTLAEARLITALATVPASQRLALILRYVDDLPVREVADLLARSERATESLLRRGRESLRQAFEEAEDV